MVTTNSVITRSADFLSQADTSVSALQPMLALPLFDLLARGGRKSSIELVPTPVA
jgi:hypothetical protein